MSLLQIILKSLYFFAPAYSANMFPVLFRNVPFLSFPINEKYFGVNKTYRGLIVAILGGTAVFFLQRHLFTVSTLGRSLSIIDYSSSNFLALGFLLAVGAIGGDLIESYFKRKMGINSGESWVPFDQLDFVFGALLCSSWLYVLAFEYLLVLLLLSPFLHIATNHLAFALKIRSEKW